MEFKDIITALKEHENSEEYNTYINGLLTADRLDKFLETDAGKKYLQPKLDSYHAKGLESWKSNNLSKEVEKLYKQKHPDADPKDAELAEVKAELERMKRENTRKDLKNKALSYFNEKKLPADLVDFILGDDEESTNANIKRFEKGYSSSLSAAVEAKIKDNSYTPPSGDNGGEVDGVLVAFNKKNPGLKY